MKRRHADQCRCQKQNNGRYRPGKDVDQQDCQAGSNQNCYTQGVFLHFADHADCDIHNQDADGDPAQTTSININAEHKEKLENLGFYIYNETIVSDLIIFLRIRQTKDKDLIDNQIFAMPFIIGKDINNGRPIISCIILNIEYENIFSNQNGVSEEYKEKILNIIFLHEFTHILGFDKEILEDKGLIKKISIKSRANSNFDIPKYVVNSSKIVEKAQAYYNCKKLDYIEFSKESKYEDVKNSHWEGRILLGEYMTSHIYYQEQAISEFTLALLDELNWYEVNYFTGGLMRFGKNQGCEFINNDCIKKDTTNNEPSFNNEFCSGSDSWATCSSGRQSRGYCNNIYSSGYFRAKEPEFYRGFSNGYGINYVEYCPISFDSNTMESNYFIGNCNFGNSNFGNSFENDFPLPTYKENSEFFGEKLGNNSFCALSSILNYKRYSGVYKGLVRPTCYSMFCSNRSLTIELYSDNKDDIEYIVCPRKGGLIKIGIDKDNYTNFKGYLFCPDYNLICTGTIFCNNLFDCIEKKSLNKGNLNYDYNYSKNNNLIEITSSYKIQENLETFFNITEGFEESENGKCPINCSQCLSYKRCILCRKFREIQPYAYYIGEVDNNLSHINCTDTIPERGYYNINKYDDEEFIHFFKCIENCNVCQNATNCEQCLPTHKIKKDDKSCEIRISNCILYDERSRYFDNENNNGGEGYKECLHCNIDENYFCLKMDKTNCKYINDSELGFYYRMENESDNYSCIERCNNKFNNCLKCNKNKCIICEPEFLVNNTGQCEERIPHCKLYNKSYTIPDKLTNGGGDSYPECEQCNNDLNYFCLNMNKSTCVYVDPEKKENYYDLEKKEYPCIKECSSTFPYCRRCNESQCKDCIAIFKNSTHCYKPIDNCLEYEIPKEENGEYANCKKCNESNHYYCIGENRTYCEKIISFDGYFQLDNYSCLQKCEVLLEYCKLCNKTNCLKCLDGYILIEQNNSTKCLPHIQPAADDICDIKINEYNNNINKLELEYFIDYYFTKSLNYNHRVHHFVGNNFTVTLFIHSECTEDLLNQGYFKIDSKELYEKMLEKANIKENELLFSIFVVYNFQNYFTFFDIYTRHLNESEVCKECLKIPYTLTNRYNFNLNLIFGKALGDLVSSEKINIFSDDSKCFTDICENITLKKVDIPYKERLHLLYLHDYSKQVACTSKDCELIDINYEESISVCKCKIGNKFEDIKYPIIEFENYQDPDIDKKSSISDTFGIIKCVKNGLKSKNVFANGGAFITIIAIILVIILYIIYCACYKVIKVEKIKVYNPPPKLKNQLFLFRDWQKNKEENDTVEKNIDDHDLIQSRDEDDGGVLEEDVPFSNNCDISNFSLDTELGELKKKLNNKNKISEKNGKTVLVLLPNKRKIINKEDDENSDEKEDIEYFSFEKARKNDKRNCCQMYWYVLSIKQHIINFFSSINCCKITESYVPLPIRLIRSVFMIVLAFLLNILFLNQSYFSKKFSYFNQNYKLLAYKNEEYIVNAKEITDEKIPGMKFFIYALTHTLINGIIVFAILIVLQFILALIFFNLRNKLLELFQKNNFIKVQDLISKTKIKYIIFFILTIVLLLVFLVTFLGFGGAYGGGFIDYLTGGIISLIILEIFPFIWSIVIALFRYIGIRKGIKCCYEFSQFFMF